MKDRKERFLQKARLAATTSYDLLLFELRDHEHKATVLKGQIIAWDEEIEKLMAKKEEKREQLEAIENLIDFKQEVVRLMTSLGEDKT